MLVLTTLNQVLCKLQNSLLWCLKILRSVEIYFKNVFTSLLTLLLFVYFSEVLHVHQIANLFVEEHVKYFDREDSLFIRFLGIWTRVFSSIDQCRLVLSWTIESIKSCLTSFAFLPSHILLLELHYIHKTKRFLVYRRALLLLILSE